MRPKEPLKRKKYAKFNAKYLISNMKKYLKIQRWRKKSVFKLFCISKIKYRKEKANEPLTIHLGWGMA